MSDVGIFVLVYAPTEQRLDAWVRGVDVDAYGGTGYVDLALEAHDALRFASPAAAIAFREQVSTVKPLRADGEPNRPLTAFEAEIRPLPPVAPA